MGGEREKGKLCPGQPGGAVMGPSYDYLIFFAFSGEKKKNNCPSPQKNKQKTHHQQQNTPITTPITKQTPTNKTGIKQISNNNMTGMNKTAMLAGWCVYVFHAIAAITKTY